MAPYFCCFGGSLKLSGQAQLFLWREAAVELFNLLAAYKINVGYDDLPALPVKRAADEFMQKEVRSYGPRRLSLLSYTLAAGDDKTAFAVKTYIPFYTDACITV